MMLCRACGGPGFPCYLGNALPREIQMSAAMDVCSHGNSPRTCGTCLAEVKASAQQLPTCSRCGGLGHRAYPTSATWHGGAGGMTVTGDLCDRCWGSGDESEPFPNLKEGFRRFNDELAKAKNVMSHPGVQKMWLALQSIKSIAKDANPHAPIKALDEIKRIATDVLEGK